MVGFWRCGKALGGLACAVALALALAACDAPSRAAREKKFKARLEALWSQASPTPVGRYDAGRSLYKKRRYADAEFIFQRWLATYPKNPLEPAALYYLASSQYYGGKRAEAMASCRRVMKDYPKTDWAVFARQDLVALGAGPPEGALREHFWHPWDWFRPNPPAVTAFERARRLFLAREFDKALAAFRALGERDPKSALAPACWYYAARCYEYAAQLEKARDTYQHVIATYPATEWEWLAQEDLRRLRTE